MVKFGAHSFLWIDVWTTEKGNFAINKAAQAGFEVVEIPLLRPNEFEGEVHKQVLRDSGIEVVASLALPAELHMPENPDGAKQFLFNALQKLQDAGGTYLCGCIAFTIGKFTGNPPTQTERQIVMDTLGEVAAKAKTMGMTLGLEVVNRNEGYLYNTLADAREAIKIIGADNLNLHADTYHMNIEEEGFYTPLVECADALAYIHMSESHRGLIGTGTVNWDEVFRGLKDANYNGTLTLESFTSINPDIADATKLWRAPKYTPDVFASKGLEFLKTNAAKYNL
jgi:D-psicose/D-tagatose/L-ribulose 3-epimerase